MKAFRLFLIFVFLYCPAAIANACSWALPTGNVSEWVKDKTIFWGRPIESKWDGKIASAGPFKPSIYTNIELIEPLNGTPPSIVKVRHHTDIGMCGISYRLGTIQIIVVEEIEDGDYTADETITYVVHPFILYLHLAKGTDFSIEEMSKHHKALRSDEETCPSTGEKQSDYCKWEELFFETSEAFNEKRDELAMTHKQGGRWSRLIELILSYQ